MGAACGVLVKLEEQAALDSFVAADNGMADIGTCETRAADGQPPARDPATTQPPPSSTGR